MTKFSSFVLEESTIKKEVGKNQLAVGLKKWHEYKRSASDKKGMIQLAPEGYLSYWNNKIDTHEKASHSPPAISEDITFTRIKLLSWFLHQLTCVMLNAN